MAHERREVDIRTVEAIFLKMNEQDQKFRQIQRAATSDCLKLLTEKFEAIQIAQTKSLEDQRTSIKTPLPKYNGKAGEFDDWKENVLRCIVNNNWTDERRTLEMLPSCLTGQAQAVFKSLSGPQKASLDGLFAALKEALDPASKSHNRELFLRARRAHGESMHSFVSRCNQYVKRADDIETVDESTWANPFIVEKIYANLNPIDRKILKISTETEDVQTLCSKADELLLVSEDVVGSLDWERTNKRWQRQHPEYGVEGNDYDRGQIPSCQNQYQSFDQHKYHRRNKGPEKTQEFRPGGGGCQMEHHELVSWNSPQTGHMSRPGGENLHGDCFAIDDEEEVDEEIEKKEDKKMEGWKKGEKGEGNPIDIPHLSAKTVAYTDHGESGATATLEKAPNNPSKEGENWVPRV